MRGKKGREERGIIGRDEADGNKGKQKRVVKGRKERQKVFMREQKN